MLGPPGLSLHVWGGTAGNKKDKSRWSCRFPDVHKLVHSTGDFGKTRNELLLRQTGTPREKMCNAVKYTESRRGHEGDNSRKNEILTQGNELDLLTHCNVTLSVPKGASNKMYYDYYY